MGTDMREFGERLVWQLVGNSELGSGNCELGGTGSWLEAGNRELAIRKSDLRTGN